MDILDRLRAHHEGDCWADAADEIERLRQRIAELEFEAEEEYGPSRPSGVYDLKGNYLRPISEKDREFIRGNLYNGVLVGERD